MRGSDGSSGALRSLRERNRAEVIKVLRRERSLSRADIARHTGLSRTTISSLVGDLQASGIVVEVAGSADDEVHASRGRPGVRLALEPSAGTALGVDFGHTHVRVAIADLSSRVLAERHAEVDVDHSAATALDAAAELVDSVLAEAGVDRDTVIAVGMGLPGPIDSETGQIGSSVILPGWAGVRPGPELNARLDLSIEVDNDANLGALGELTFGAAQGARNLIYVKLASGIGAGLVLGGRLHRGATGIAGEIGHVLVNPDGPVCRCGSRGCLETVAGAPALLDLLRPTLGGDVTLSAMLAACEDGDAGTRRVVMDAGRAVGRAVADLVNSLNPELIVVGGHLAAAGDPLIDGVRESIGRYSLPAAAQASEVRAGVLGERAGVLGALALVISDTERLNAAHLASI
ncbi:MAG: hypothetical protein QOE28_757 [Solirubrobacteraceae bacterium]|nr:hypothetical protein [Solirubrobacteraceae bacterium]